MTENRLDNENTLRALVIEDDPEVSRVYRKVLAGYGFKVDITGDGQTAVSMAEKTRYHFFISELRVPGLSGIEIYCRLGKIYPGMADRIVFTAAVFNGDEINNFIRDEHTVVLLKPFTPEELRKPIEKYLNGGQIS